MDIIITPSLLSGKVRIPVSKSFAHRQLIAAALSDKPTEIIFNGLSEDILATIHCIESLSSKADTLPEKNGFLITPMQETPNEAELFCNESGSTLRFMLPVVAALGINGHFTGAGRLPLRPNAPLIDAMRKHGIHASCDLLPLTLSGTLYGGRYEIAGNISSQYITGLMMALPLCKEDSEICFTTPLESAAYLDITENVLKQFGIAVQKTDNGYIIPGNQRYLSPERIITEGDWSSAVFWYVGNEMGHEIEVDGLNPASCQGDSFILQQLLQLGSEIDVSQTPDSLPALAVAACVHPGTTHFTGGARLRMKESDRLTAVANMLKNLGQDVLEEQDGLIIHGGKRFTGGTVDGCNDHRIVMAAAIAGSIADAPVKILGCEAVKKSYPDFFNDYAALGGILNVQ